MQCQGVVWRGCTSSYWRDFLCASITCLCPSTLSQPEILLCHPGPSRAELASSPPRSSSVSLPALEPNTVWPTASSRSSGSPMEGGTAASMEKFRVFPVIHPTSWMQNGGFSSSPVPLLCYSCYFAVGDPCGVTAFHNLLDILICPFPRHWGPALRLQAAAFLATAVTLIKALVLSPPSPPDCADSRSSCPWDGVCSLDDPYSPLPTVTVSSSSRPDSGLLPGPILSIVHHHSPTILPSTTLGEVCFLDHFGLLPWKPLKPAVHRASCHPHWALLRYSFNGHLWGTSFASTVGSQSSPPTATQTTN